MYSILYKRNNINILWRLLLPKKRFLMRSFSTSWYQSMVKTSSLDPSINGKPIPIVILRLRIPFLIEHSVSFSSITKTNFSCKNDRLKNVPFHFAGQILAAHIQIWSSGKMEKFNRSPFGPLWQELCIENWWWILTIHLFYSWIKFCTSS